MMAGLGIDIGGTKISGALFDESGMVSQKKTFYIGPKEGEKAGDLVRKMIGNFESFAGDLGRKIEGIGIAVPGIFYRSTGCVWAPNIPGWDNFPLRQEVQEAAMAGPQRLSLESDRTCYILGENWKGVSAGCRDVIFLAAGTGIGAGIMSDGKILRGSADIAGAVGWMGLTDAWMEEYEHCGCFEFHASGTGIERLARKILKEKKRTFSGKEDLDIEHITAKDVFEAADRGDRIANQIIDHGINYWAKASANLVSIFNPEMIVFGGGIFGPAARYLDRIKQEAARWAQPVSMKGVRFEPSGLQGDAGLFGAGYLSVAEEQDGNPTGV